MAEGYQSFLGTGWGFPPVFNRAAKGVDVVSGEEDIRQSIRILLSTELGERVMLPEYGSELNRLIFEPLDESLKSLIQSFLKDAIQIHEPRITVDEVILTEYNLEGRVDIEVEYTIPNNNTRSNFVFPFYKEEATNL